ncbi:MAG TPA: DUF4396 domain-containing protein [Gammaproteobacteria bacterium]|nr:DUF4396 domain-containing protein [Gammaproteobacteria bacterium]
MTLLHWISVIWIVVCLISASWAAWDVVADRPRMWIMMLVWPLTMLYLGPLGLWFYRRTRRRRGQAPFSEAVLKGAMHCGAGCAVGDFAGEWLVFLLGISILGSELLTKYVFAFTLAYSFGIFFQYFAIAPMRKLAPGPGIVAALKADTLSLVAFEVGMFAWMAVTYLLLPGLTPVRPEYWFMMQVAMMLGLATTFPVNWWLIRTGWKERM